MPMPEHFRRKMSGDGPGTVGTGSEKQPVAAAWDFASKLFPRSGFPWEILPARISESLQQLARSCATSPNHLPGVAFCQLAAVLGRTLSISPKHGWREPFIFWVGDIRESGDGKTPPGKMMMGPLRAAQEIEHHRYLRDCEEHRKLSKKEKKEVDQPVKARGYYVTDLTLEGLREESADHPHGGIVVDQSELSAFVSSQNQYKSKGSDREAWLALWDGNPARVVRVGKSILISGARVSLYGGIQPAVFARCFSGENGLYLVDGTAFRFLFSFEPSIHHDLTAESWDESVRATWETLLHRGMAWADGEIREAGGRIEKPKVMILDREAQSRFIHWRNALNKQRESIPPQFRGFLPKAYSYALRLTGIVHCMHRFDSGQEPDFVLTMLDIERGISAIGFYLGQAVDAMQLIVDEDHKPKQDMNPLQRRVIEAILSMQGEIRDGMLPTRRIMEIVNGGVDERFVTSADAIGGAMASLGLPNRRTATARGYFIRPEDFGKFRSMLNTPVTSVTSVTNLDSKPSYSNDTSLSQVSQVSQVSHPASQGSTRDRDACDTCDAPLMQILRKCSDCILFDGQWCTRPEGSWNGARGQNGNTLHPCNYFEDSSQTGREAET